MKSVVVIVAMIAGLVTALPAAAQFRNAEAAVKYRQSVMQMQAYHFGRLAGMAQGRVPFDAKVAAEDAALLDTIDKLPFVAFVEGSDKAGNTRAKPGVWTDRAKFDAASVKLQEEAAKLNVAAKTGSLDAIKAAVPGVAGACKACHDNFQAQ
jgi:cytochrome c556